MTSLDHVAFLLNYLCVCGLCDLKMGNKKRLSQETIAQIIALKSAGHQTKEISAMTGVCIRQVHFWVARLQGSGKVAALTHPHTKSAAIGRKKPHQGLKTY